MSTLAVAKKEFNDARRSKVLWGVVVVFALAAGLFALGYAEFIANRSTTGVNTKGLILTLYSGLQIPFLNSVAPIHVFLPFVGLLLGYRSIVKERESGQIKLLLSLPNSRADVVLGKLLGRSVVGVFAILVGFVVAMGVGVVSYQEFDPVAFMGFFVATLIFLVVYICIGISISSASPSTPFAIAGVAVYVTVFHALWGLAFLFVKTFALDIGLTERGPDWFIFLREINPARAYNHLVTLFVDLPTARPDNLPIYLQDWFFLFVMLFWVVVPLGIGYALFEYADL